MRPRLLPVARSTIDYNVEQISDQLISAAIGDRQFSASATGVFTVIVPLDLRVLIHPKSMGRLPRSHFGTQPYGMLTEY
jgi:hypothetical protein